MENLHDRMKEYEASSQTSLSKKMPVIIRLDGKAFHSFTRGLQRPFDPLLHEAMIETAKFLCENTTNCRLAYTQSDEISLLLVNYETSKAESWFKNNLQKLVSVSASMATLAFNRAYRRLVEEHSRTVPAFPTAVYEAKQDSALFDSRAFVLSREEVCNYFIDRQQDASRNSIQGLAQTTFSRKELVGLNQNQLQEKLWQEKGLNWSACPDAQKRGSCILRTFDGEEVRQRWKADLHIPVFTQDRNYINRFVYPEDNGREVIIVGAYPELENELPTVFRFKVPDIYGREDVIELFYKGLKECGQDDRIGNGMAAAEYVCKMTKGTVEYIEPDQEISIE